MCPSECGLVSPGPTGPGTDTGKRASAPCARYLPPIVLTIILIIQTDLKSVFQDEDWLMVYNTW